MIIYLFLVEYHVIVDQNFLGYNEDRIFLALQRICGHYDINQ